MAVSTRKRVAILSSRGLFREGLRGILAEAARISVAASPEEIAGRLQSHEIDVVILDQEDGAPIDGDLLALWLAIPDVRIITVRLDAHDVQIYHHRQIAHATPQDLIDLVREA